MLILKNGPVFTGKEILKGHAVVIEGDCVKAVVPENETPEGSIFDLQGNMAVPGFVETQLNVVECPPTAASLDAIFTKYLKFGTTGILPTIITGPQDEMLAAIAAVKTCVNARHPGIIGIHLEGPFISPVCRRAHPEQFIRKPDEKDFSAIKDLVDVGGVVLLTLAPEETGQDVVRRFRDLGAVVSVGHSNADRATAQAAFEAGARGVTHLFNAMTGPRGREEGSLEKALATGEVPGVIGAALDAPGIWLGMIDDGAHIRFENLKKAIEAMKGTPVLVTDSWASDKKTFMLGNETVTEVDGILRKVGGEDAGRRAGSVMDMATCVRNATERMKLPFEKALQMASLNPAEFLGRSDLGRIAPGAKANIAVINAADIRVLKVILAGKPVQGGPVSKPGFFKRPGMC